ncbi:uroporphyrinogen-III C-methyltransferase [Curvibacter sp. APW13]|uniref:uroporphyrinogen-III C-methyltransferase n=1 Tax=Curvibacter sp. APW13 TaxID=3077236 RepID=UPI0028DD4430|nr:uroporphyrinogen-III C-methyltransferase [Curvibacter sp. APW13]MDT8991541.1 uroporphyrinogen-III C-methyltransferase [Curvibacter sp. APW13]
MVNPLNAMTPASALLTPALPASQWGQVCLVGAGPGDPELLTLKAHKRLQQADVVVYDALVGAGVLDMIPAHVERIYVGKESSNHTLPQDDITLLLVQLAQRGKKVVRLKGGDPFVFGRGGEELATITDAGIAAEVVPGITAALGASACTGIPLTHRDHAQSCVFVTGHRKDGTYTLDWPVLARPNQTVVIYMGVGSLDGIVTELVAHGRSPDTPVALVRHATHAKQQTVVGRLDSIAELARTHAVKPPALIVIGEVVSLYRAEQEAVLRQATKSWA